MIGGVADSNSLLTQVPGRVVKIFALPPDTCTPATQTDAQQLLEQPLVIVQEDSIAVCNGSSGELYHYYEFGAKTGYGAIVEAIFVGSHSRFIIAFEDKSVAALELSSNRPETCNRQQWQVEIRHMFESAGTVVCLLENGCVAQFVLDESGELPTAEVAAAAGVAAAAPIPIPVTSRAGGLLFRSNQLAAAAVVGARASNTIATPARGRSSSKRKRAEQEEAQQTDGSSLSLKIWPLIEGFSMGSAAADIELLPCSSEVPLNALQGGTVLDMVCQTGSRSIILLVESSAGGYGSAYSLIKMTFEGEVLYQRQITAAAAQGRPLYIQEATSHILWIACDNGTFVSWDSCYGVALRSVTLPSAHSSTIPRSWLVDYQHSNFDPVAGPVVDAHVLSSSYIITLSAAIHSKPSNINRTIGNKASSKSGSESSSSIYSFSLYSLLTSGDADAVNAAYIGGTLSDCVGKLDPDAAAITASNSLIDDTEDISATKKATAVLKKRLAERQLLDDLGDLSVFAPLTEYEKVSVYSLQLPDDDEMPVRLPVSTLQTVAVSISKAAAGDYSDADWIFFKAVIKTGAFSIVDNSSVLQHAVMHQRFDILAAIVEFVEDLTEVMCVNVLLSMMRVTDDALMHLYLEDGRIEWSVDAADADGAGSSKAGAASSSKRKKTSKSSKVTTVSRTDADDEVHSLQRIILLRATFEACLRRRAAYSVILLGEALQILPPGAAVLLFRVVAFFLRGVLVQGGDKARGGNNSGTQQQPMNLPLSTHLTPALNDLQLQHAISWQEALIDGHFSSLAMNAVTHEPTRSAVSNAIVAVSAINEAAENLQSALGLWTQIKRVVCSGGQQVKPVTALYQIETIDM